MTNESVEDILAIGIEKITAVRNMAPLLHLGENKEDVRYVLETMHNELEEGIAEIDHIIAMRYTDDG